MRQIIVRSISRERSLAVYSSRYAGFLVYINRHRPSLSSRRQMYVHLCGLTFIGFQPI